MLRETLGTGTRPRAPRRGASPRNHITRWSSETKVNPPPSNCFFALKIMKKSEVVRLKQVEHIKNEKEILSEVNHPFIVTLCAAPPRAARHRARARARRRARARPGRPALPAHPPARRLARSFIAFQDERNLYMLLEYIIGGELFTHLRKAGKFGNDHTRFYAAQIVMALQYLHNDSVVYRDLKPENLLLDLIGYLKITDFGFAKKVEDRTWTLCGTPSTSRPRSSRARPRQAVDCGRSASSCTRCCRLPAVLRRNPFGIYRILAGARSPPLRDARARPHPQAPHRRAQALGARAPTFLAALHPTPPRHTPTSYASPPPPSRLRRQLNGAEDIKKVGGP